MVMGNDFSIELTMSNEINPLDAVVRAMNIIRRGKIAINHIVIDMSDSVIRISMAVRGEEDEVRWVCNKLDKLYDIVNVKYMPIELRANMVVMGNGKNIQR
jgi:acetolactate synthase II small subunit